jgi:hypothetical protein
MTSFFGIAVCQLVPDSDRRQIGDKGAHQIVHEADYTLLSDYLKK